MISPYPQYARFTGRCCCGGTVEPAFHSGLGVVFWNCFDCFPIYTKATGSRRRRFLKRFRKQMIRAGDWDGAQYVLERIQETPT